MNGTSIKEKVRRFVDTLKIVVATIVVFFALMILAIVVVPLIPGCTTSEQNGQVVLNAWSGLLMFGAPLIASTLFAVRLATKKRKSILQNALENKAAINKAEANLSKGKVLLEQIEQFEATMLSCFSVHEFAYNYVSINIALTQLSRLDDAENIQYAVEAEHRVERFQNNTNKIVEQFIDRVVADIFRDSFKWANKLERFILDVESNETFSQLLNDKHNAKLNSLKERCKEENVISTTFATIDAMDGHSFEYWCAELLKKNGYVNVGVTPGSGDHGVDVLAEKEGIKYAIQCKCYSKDLDNTPVQEVFAGKEMYDCHVGVVMTNRHFTAGAKELAAKDRVLLWDRDVLKKMFQKASLC